MNSEKDTKHNKSVIVAICGLHGAGKTTLLARLQQQFGHHPYLFFKNNCYDNIRMVEYRHPEYEIQEVQRWNPDYSIPYIWAKVFDYLQYFRHYIRPALHSSHFVFSDRWSYCYQALAMTIPEVAPVVWRMLKAIPHPNLTIYLDCQPEEAYRRLVNRGITTPEETIEQLQLLRSNYTILFNELGWNNIIKVPPMSAEDTYACTIRALQARYLPSTISLKQNIPI